MKKALAETLFYRTRSRLNGLLLLLLLFLCQNAAGQIGNSISGHVFGADRRPLVDINVELLDDLSRTISRSRTNAAGRYTFVGLGSGRFAIRILPLGTGYEEAEQDVEIVNIIRATTGGGVRIAGHVNEQRDFYLRLRKGADALGAPASVFVQDVPPKALDLYKAALSHFEDKRTKEALASLKEAIEVFPKYFAALEMLGLEYFNAGHFGAAQVLLSIAVDVNPRADRSWYGIARTLDARKNYAEALAAVEKSLEINGSSPESLFLAGSLLRRAREYSKAEKLLEKARDLSGDSMPDVHWELALLYGNGTKRYKEAARELRLYLKARPNDKNVENIRKLIVDFEVKAKSNSD